MHSKIEQVRNKARNRVRQLANPYRKSILGLHDSGVMLTSQIGSVDDFQVIFCVLKNRQVVNPLLK